ncbi:NAD(P)H-dependent oxidoreductase [Clostridium sp. Marseille-P2415]|uniref:NAD(P)H-dependent oxidoreductase n=1 Tax=Clostridium sp. Marseille-P2415 TaxID=1805471 RepID=UPI00098876D6|nr:NAD(P)H-dependent oxidoreductase [Clostridium sp. Marseille-P2415]
MNHLIVFAHPNPNSFGKGIVDAAVKASEEKGANVEVRDLYAMGFDPILKPSDFEAFQSGKIPEDILTEQKYIKWADVITFIHPIWWSAQPGIMKGYVDRVFSNGFAYEYVDGAAHGLLSGKKGMVFATSGSPNEAYEANGMHHSMKQITDQGIFHFCGVEEVKHTFYGAVPYVTEETRKDYLKEVAEIVKGIL